MTDGPDVNMWDGLAVVAWLTAVGLITGDLFTEHGEGLGPLTPFGGLVALAASVLTMAGIARRSKNEVLEAIRRSIALEREVVRHLHR